MGYIQGNGGALSINEWWKLLADGPTPQHKALATLMLLTVWELWNKRNARVFHNKSSPSFVVLSRIKMRRISGC
jgi:hypothetical protein